LTAHLQYADAKGELVGPEVVTPLMGDLGEMPADAMESFLRLEFVEILRQILSAGTSDLAHIQKKKSPSSSRFIY